MTCMCVYRDSAGKNSEGLQAVIVAVSDLFRDEGMNSRQNTETKKQKNMPTITY